MTGSITLPVLGKVICYTYKLTPLQAVVRFKLLPASCNRKVISSAGSVSTDGASMSSNADLFAFLTKFRDTVL